MKLPAHRAELPGKVVPFYVVPLAPVLKDGDWGAHAGQTSDGAFWRTGMKEMLNQY